MALEDADSLRGAGTVLLLAALFSFLFGIGCIALALWLSSNLQAQGTAVANEVSIMLVVVGVLLLGGGELSLRAYRFARRGDASAAFSRALLAAFLPPVQPLALVGAIMCKLVQARRDDPLRRAES